MNKTKFYTIIVLALGLFFTQNTIFAQNNAAVGKWTFDKVNLIFPEGTKEEEKEQAGMFMSMFEQLKGKMSLEFYANGKGLATGPKDDNKELELETKQIKSWKYDAKNGLLLFTIEGQREEKNKVTFKNNQMILTPAPDGQEMPMTLQMIFNK
jgi:hypothetical protein